MLKAVWYFHSYLEGSKFKLFTDHGVLTFMLKMVDPKWKIARWIKERQQFDFEISHKLDASLRNANTMSQLLIPASKDPSEVMCTSKLWEGTEYVRQGQMESFK